MDLPEVTERNFNLAAIPPLGTQMSEKRLFDFFSQRKDTEFFPRAAGRRGHPKHFTRRGREAGVFAPAIYANPCSFLEAGGGQGAHRFGGYGTSLPRAGTVRHISFDFCTAKESRARTQPPSSSFSYDHPLRICLRRCIIVGSTVASTFSANISVRLG
jgi:hypothetical protein